MEGSHQNVALADKAEAGTGLLVFLGKHQAQLSWLTLGHLGKTLQQVS